VFNRESPANARRPRRVWRVACAFALGLALLAGLALLGAIGLQSTGTLAEVDAVMDVLRPWLHGAQLTVTAALWLRWPQFIQCLARRRLVGNAAVTPLLRARHRLMAFVLLMQLTVGMGVHFSLLSASSGR